MINMSAFVLAIGGIFLDTNNLDMAKLMSMLSSLDQKQLEEGFKKASQILNSNDKEKIIKELKDKKE